MKKSTLITTIAMIVVVVVALSTATYAWFSSSATAIANTSFTTGVTGDWTIMLGTVDGENYNDLSYVGTAADTIDLTEQATAINTGLWCPISEIQTTLATSEASTTLANRAGFVSAEKTGSKYMVKKLQTEAMNGTAAATNEGSVKPFALRLVNVSGATKQLQLNITINAGSSGTTNSMYAASAVRFYIYEVKNTDAVVNNQATGTAYTSGYRLTGTAGLAAATATAIDTQEITETTAINMSNNLKALTKYAEQSDVDGGKAAQVGDPIYTTVTMADYSVANIESQFQTAPANLADNSPLKAIGINSGDKYKTYTFDLGIYNANDFSNIIIYTWIDGWTANASAARADFAVNYGFVSNSVYVAPTPSSGD